jgi:hypothetical protein
MRTDIDAASLGTTGDSSEAVEGIEDVFTFGPNSVLRRDGDAVADISGRGLSPEQLIEIARSTQLRPETELPRPPFICCRTLVEEEGNPGPVVAEFSLDTDDGAMTWVMTAHTDGRNIALGGYGTNDDTFGPTIALPIDSTATISSRPGRFVGPALPAGYDLVVGITRRDVAAVELKLTNNRTIKLPTTDLSGRFDARFVFAPIEVDDSTPQSNSGTPIVGFTAFDDNDNIIQPD